MRISRPVRITFRYLLYANIAFIAVLLFFTADRSTWSDFWTSISNNIPWFLFGLVILALASWVAFGKDRD